MKEADKIALFGEIIDLMRSRGIKMKLPYDFENFMDEASHTRLFETGRFVTAYAVDEFEIGQGGLLQLSTDHTVAYSSAREKIGEVLHTSAGLTISRDGKLFLGKPPEGSIEYDDWTFFKRVS